MYDTSALRSYISENYPVLEDLLTSAQYEQIAWINQAHQTNEANLAVSRAPSIIFSQQRVFDSLYFLHLFRKGDETAYEHFVAGQPEPRLEWVSFQVLSGWIQQLSPEEYQQLWVASLTIKSPEAERRVSEKTGETPAFDSVEFLKTVMTSMPATYPAAAELMETDPSARDSFACLFDTGHFRHMMYVEGNESMFFHLRQKIIEGKINADSLNFWICYWVVNIASFRSHTQERGSLYLTQHTFQALSCLEACLVELLSDPNAPVLQNYLRERATWLGLDPISPGMFHREAAPAFILARISAMQRVFTPEEGVELQRGLDDLKAGLPEEQYQEMLEILNPLRETKIPTPTYAPSFLANLKNQMGSFKEALILGLPIYAQVIKEYQKLFDQGLILVPLNLNELSSPESLRKVIAKEAFKLSINQGTGMAQISSIEPAYQLSA